MVPLHVAGITSQQARRALEAMFTSLRIAFPKGDGGEAPMRADEAFERVRCVPLYFVSSLCSSLAATWGWSPLFGTAFLLSPLLLALHVHPLCSSHAVGFLHTQPPAYHLSVSAGMR